MNIQLTKSDLLWVIVKLIGAYLVYSALAIIWAAFIAKITVDDVFSRVLSKGVENGSTVMTMIASNAVFPLIVGTYLLVSGKLLHRCLMSVPTVQVRKAQSSRVEETALTEEIVPERRIPGISLTGDDLDRFEEWLQRNPSMSKRAVADQVALFRDAIQSGDA